MMIRVQGMYLIEDTGFEIISKTRKVQLGQKAKQSIHRVKNQRRLTI